MFASVSVCVDLENDPLAFCDRKTKKLIVVNQMMFLVMFYKNLREKDKKTFLACTTYIFIRVFLVFMFMFFVLFWVPIGEKKIIAQNYAFARVWRLPISDFRLGPDPGNLKSKFCFFEIVYKISFFKFTGLPGVCLF